MLHSEAPTAASLWGLFAWREEVAPHAVLLMGEDGERVSTSQTAEHAERLASRLWRLGIRPGTVVAWQLPTRVETVILTLALARVGACQVPMIPQYRQREVTFVLRETGAEYFVIPGIWDGFDYADLAVSSTAGIDVPPRIIVFPAELASLDDSGSIPSYTEIDDESVDPVRWIFYTSGTTADPKGVQHSDRSILEAARGLANAYPITSSDVGCIAFPFAHVGGIDHLGSMLINGFSAVLLERFRATHVVETYRAFGVTLGGGGSALCQALLAEHRRHPGTPLIPSLRLLQGGGAPKPASLSYEVKDVLGVPLIPGYGMTEAPTVCMGSTMDSDEELAYTDGKPCRGVEIRIDAESPGVHVAHDGEILLRGAGVFSGYVTAGPSGRCFDRLGFFRTGDIGHIRPDGRLVVTGRLKDVIIRKGETISVRDVEDLLSAHPAIAALAVVGLPDELRGERICAVIESAREQAPTLAEIQDFCRREGLMTQKIPEQLEILPRLPRNASGKILKGEVREQILRGTQEL